MKTMIAKDSKLYVYLDTTRNTFKDLIKRRSFRYGLPFLLFVVGGSFGLKEWTQIRYQVSQSKSVSREEAEKMGLQKARDVTLESAYDEIQNLDIDNWENKRGPRPWEQTEPNPTKK